MSYFAHAFKKVFIGEEFITSGSLLGLNWGQYGFFDAKTWEAVPIADADITLHPKVVFAMGTIHDVDKVGPHGGLMESIKSQVIEPRYIHKFWKLEARDGEQHFVRVGWDTVNAAKAPKFFCGRTYRLRIDLKGSPVLRALGHNLYHVFDAYTGCCPDVSTPTHADPIWVMVQFARQINAHPVFSKFLSAGVVTGSGFADIENYVPLTNQVAIDAALAGLILVVEYEDTMFDNCYTDVLDYYDRDPVVITGAQLVDEGGDVCGDFKQLAFTEVTAPRRPQGSGGQVFRDFVMSHSYKQERFSSDMRLREVMDMHWITPDLISISSSFDTYCISHSVPRRNNPTGVYDCDQYVIQLHGLEYIDFSDFVSWMTNYLDSAGRGVVLEDYSGAV